MLSLTNDQLEAWAERLCPGLRAMPHVLRLDLYEAWSAAHYEGVPVIHQETGTWSFRGHGGDTTLVRPLNRDLRHIVLGFLLQDRVWARFEGACSTLMPSPRSVSNLESGREALALARIEAHYFVNGLFLDDDYFFANLDRLTDIPATLVQGRYDMVCPVRTADELAAAWSKAEYVIVPDAGHSAMEPGIRTALIKATEKLKKQL